MKRLSNWFCQHVVHVQRIRDPKTCWCGEVTDWSSPDPPPGYGIES